MASCRTHPLQRATEVIERTVPNYYRNPSVDADGKIVLGPDGKPPQNPVIETRKVYVCKVCAGKAPETPEMKLQRETVQALTSEVGALKEMVGKLLAAAGTKDAGVPAPKA